MSWSLEIYSGRETKLTDSELTCSIQEAAPSLRLCEAPALDMWALCDPHTNERFSLILATSFDEESDIDPELLFMLEQEIIDSDADDGDMDAEYTDQLKQTLRSARWHYTVSAARDSPEAEIATVRTAYALAQIDGGLVHDLQSGAWMDASLFEEMLDAYNASLPF